MSKITLGPGTLYVVDPVTGAERELGHVTFQGPIEPMPPLRNHPSGEFSISGTLEGIWEQCCAPKGPLCRPETNGEVAALTTKWIVDNFTKLGHDYVHEACGIRWDLNDILRFLNNFCRWESRDFGMWCLIFNGAASRGKGNKAWYGSFWCKGKTVRAHKFFAVAILGLRPRPNREDELDHHCFNTRCVSCVQVLTHAENQKRIRRRKDYDHGTHSGKLQRT